MSYSDFTYLDVVRDFGLTVEEVSGIFNNTQEIAPTDMFLTILEESRLVLRGSDNEKIRSEAIIYPLLLDLRKLLDKKISIFSGIEFNVEPERGLNGRCDFLLNFSSEQLAITAPVVVVVEAKKENLTGGLGQCIAEMIAAQIFNSRFDKNITTIYGTVTTGTSWLFLKLKDQLLTLDAEEYSIRQPGQILGILAKAFV